MELQVATFRVNLPVRLSYWHWIPAFHAKFLTSRTSKKTDNGTNKRLRFPTCFIMVSEKPPTAKVTIKHPIEIICCQLTKRL